MGRGPYTGVWQGARAEQYASMLGPGPSAIHGPTHRARGRYAGGLYGGICPIYHCALYYPISVLSPAHMRVMIDQVISLCPYAHPDCSSIIPV